MTAPYGMQNGCFLLRLIYGAQIVYPLDMLRMGVAQWNFLLVCVWLVHTIMSNHVGAQVVTRFAAVSPNGEVLPLKRRNFLYVIDIACLRGPAHL